jgi:hypothetical protein
VKERDALKASGKVGGASDAALKAKEALAAQLMEEGEKLSKRVLDLEGTIKRLRAQVGRRRGMEELSAAAVAGQAAGTAGRLGRCHSAATAADGAPPRTNTRARARQAREEAVEKARLSSLLAAEQAECEAQRRARAAAERDLAASIEASRQVGPGAALPRALPPGPCRFWT